MSDVDLLIVVNEPAERDAHRRILTYLRDFSLDRGVDLLVLSHAAIERRPAGDDRWLAKVWAESVVL